jgi:hypothetical protein
MKVQIVLIDECGSEVIADTIEAKAVEAMGEHLDSFVEMRINEIRLNYPEARCVYREDVKSYGEQIADEWERIYNEEYEWALAHEDEIDTDPEEYAHDMADSYFQNDFFL